MGWLWGYFLESYGTTTHFRFGPLHVGKILKNAIHFLNGDSYNRPCRAERTCVATPFINMEVPWAFPTTLSSFRCHVMRGWHLTIAGGILYYRLKMRAHLSDPYGTSEYPCKCSHPIFYTHGPERTGPNRTCDAMPLNWGSGLLLFQRSPSYVFVVPSG